MADEVSDSGQAVASPEERLVQFFAKGDQKSAPTQARAPVETEAVSQEAEAETQEEVQEGEQPTEEQVSDEVPEGYVELEHLGKKWHVPEELKTAFESNRKLATQSAQELAPVRRAIEVEKIALQAAKAVDSELSKLTAQLAQLDSYKEQARKLDWSSLTLDQKVDLDRELRNIEEQRQAVGSQIEQRKAAAQQQFGQFVVQAVQETEKFMSAKVPGWGQETGKALHQYGTELGIPVEKLTAGWFADPVATHVMWKAQQWDKLQSSKPSVENKVRSAAPVIKPASSQVQKSVAQSNYQKERSQLKKSGSLEDAARLFLRMK
jgi:hypothetical protein